MNTQRDKEVKTRVNHICGSCGKTIPKGSMAQSMSGIFVCEGKCFPYSFYFCQMCMAEADTDEGEEEYQNHLDWSM